MACSNCSGEGHVAGSDHTGTSVGLRSSIAEPLGMQMLGAPAGSWTTGGRTDSIGERVVQAGIVEVLGVTDNELPVAPCSGCKAVVELRPPLPGVNVDITNKEDGECKQGTMPFLGTVPVCYQVKKCKVTSPYKIKVTAPRDRTIYALSPSSSSRGVGGNVIPITNGTSTTFTRRSHNERFNRRGSPAAADDIPCGSDQFVLDLQLSMNRNGPWTSIIVKCTLCDDKLITIGDLS
jgi:hypothetical protein